MESKLLTAQEVADILKIKKNTVYELIKRGELPSKKVGKQVRVSDQDIHQYLKTEESVSPAPKPVPAKAALSSPADSLILCGQDISLDIIANYLSSYPELPNLLRSHAGSYNSLHALYQSKVHIATAHLWDEATKTYNYPYITKLIPGIPVTVVRLFGRMQGFYVLKENPKGIRGWQDLKRTDLNFANREKGSGTRVLLDERLKALGIDRNAFPGYEKEYTSHISIASAISRGESDFGLGSEQGCHNMNSLAFIPLQCEWYDMVFYSEQEDTRVFEAILDYIGSEKFLTELTALGGYDITQTGKIKRL